MTGVATAFVSRATAGGRLFALGMLLGPLATAAACAATAAVGPGVGIDLRFPPGLPSQQETSLALRIIASLTVLALLPSILVCLSTFLRIIIVLSMLRQAIGMPETPPNVVLIGLALFLTLFTMAPVWETLHRDTVQPYLEGRLGHEAAFTRAGGPLKEHLLKHTRQQDLALIIELAKVERPDTAADVGLLQLIPAYMLSELRAAFQIGFVIFLPFLLIDLIVASILMALGMMMMPPVTVALPLKVLMFVLVDGWSLVLRALVGSFH